MRSALLVSLFLAGVAGCPIDSDATLDFTNQTNETVWIGFNGFAPDGFKIPDGLWTEAGPGERVVITDGGCVSGGDLVVATEPVESAVIDVRQLIDVDTEVCPGEDWEWSGIGDPTDSPRRALQPAEPLVRAIATRS